MKPFFQLPLLIALLQWVLTLQSLTASTVSTITIPSTKMAKDIPATLILPDSYAKNKSHHFPVLYLLHGAGGDEKNWNKYTDIASFADTYQMIIICPSGGYQSWYFDSPIDPKFQYESYIIQDCVPYMDKHYRTKANRKSRAICGNSMGGHGALFLAIRHQDIFATAVALSGGVDIRPFSKKWSISKRIGNIKKHPENWEKLTVINLAKTLKDGDLTIALDCGKGDFFLKVNRALHKQLLDAGVQHHYTERPGKHNWTYWKGAIQRQIPVIDKQFKAAP